MPLARVCVFCGSSPGLEAHRRAAERLGRLLPARGLGLVYGGGGVGLMGVLADAVLQAGGEVIGVIPGFLFDREVGHRGLTALHVVPDMHARKALMAERADAFAALPGGFGTLEELFEVVTWALLGVHDKPIGLLNVDGYFDDLLRFLDRATKDGLIRPEHRGLLRCAAAPEALLDALQGALHPEGPGPAGLAQT